MPPPPTPKTLQMRGPFDARRGGEQTFDKMNKLADEKLKSPQVVPPQLSSGSSTEYTYQGANQNVFNRIKDELVSRVHPPILLGEHIVHNWDRVVELSKQRFFPVMAHRNTLDGIDFIVEDRQKLFTAIRNARIANNEINAAFVEGSIGDWKKHWALALSFQATEGIGFREIYRPKIVDRPIENPNKMGFDARFGRDITVDVSSLHIAISESIKLRQTRCNIHIDNLTVTLGGIGDEVRISPSVINHFVNELLWKTKMKGKVPDWAIDAFDISLLNPDEGFLRAGVGATLINNPKLRWTINYSAGLNNNTHPEWSGKFRVDHSVTTGLTVTFDLGGG